MNDYEIPGRRHKAHVGVDVTSGLVHTVTTNTADVTQTEHLLHGKEKTVWAEAGYTGADKRVDDAKLKRYIAAKRGAIKAMSSGAWKEATCHVEYLKAAVRAKVEHPFRSSSGSSGTRRFGIADWRRTPGKS